MEKTIVTVTLPIPMDKAWEVIGAVGGVDTWSPIIKSCRIESTREGGLKRYCSAEQGELIEKILLLDHQNHVLSYAITEQPILPVSSLVSSIEVSGDDFQAVIKTTSTFEVNDGANPVEIKSMIEQIYTGSYAGIAALVTQAA
ncbi:Polyketide cyclase / dehydrase and lipid transport [Algoriphagus ornithinivorans]|uniref:Polyketide cyclase / dehydrase and lipid transport n=1 Tax=Algoriphagus ornithinivorans TaxID=226506 RepID=A0A1I5E334_9BACT|nr:SRPBCC family protein [Algoriphagus ornithinivorans]SFO05836.1 Polyketide cyclase / dehydrase and lipid transport [Algoriphagus ornithinivorans]